MSRTVMIYTIALVMPFFAAGDPPTPQATDGLPTGKWQVEFANGVIEACAFDEDKATEVEPQRSSNGKAMLKGGSVVIAFETIAPNGGPRSASAGSSNTGAQVRPIHAASQSLGSPSRGNNRTVDQNQSRNPTNGPLRTAPPTFR